MPVPAGTGIDRRQFMLRAAGGLLSVYGAGRLGLANGVLGDGIAQAAALQAPDAPILVSIFLAGGLDALSLLAPAGDRRYERLRPTLAVKPGTGKPFSEDPRLVWHPSAAAFATLHEQGKVTVFPGIGYSDPNMSHFTSRHYWEVGATDSRTDTGWLGRYLDLAGQPDNPLQGLSMDGQMNPTLASARNPVAAIGLPYQFSLWMPGVGNPILASALDAAYSLGDSQLDSPDPATAQVARAASDTRSVAAELAPFRSPQGTATYATPVPYPVSTVSSFPARLAGLAAMLAAGLPIRCVAVTADIAFDTHSSQSAEFDAGLGLVADSIGAFQGDLEARGLADRVLIHVWSEFGRRVEENGSLGTDHGAAGASLVIGTRASGRMVGEWPGLTKLDVNGNQIETADFRGLYCSLLEQFLGQDAAPVIPGAARFPRYRLLR